MNMGMPGIYLQQPPSFDATHFATGHSQFSAKKAKFIPCSLPFPPEAAATLPVC